MPRRQPGAALLAQGAVFLETIDELAETDWKRLPAPSSCWAAWWPATPCAAASKQQMELWDAEPHWVVPSAHEAGVVNGYDHPNRLGADRWVALIGARCARCWRRRRTAAGAGGDGRHGRHGGRACDGRATSSAASSCPAFGADAQGAGDGHCRPEGPTGEVVDFPTNTSDALMSGGANAIAGAIERQHRKLLERTGKSQRCS